LTEDEKPRNTATIALGGPGGWKSW